ncbi:tRNA (adenosine(37)-N6)-threonylcarbamoyltransferase complex transferase subunit TsaD [Deferribacter thermophilus]|uniref:tRNA (adenosine(37)-N6)-threonylcarbamoyltransferase complex transferase subunit TsaD n=1 Tax=Deferribacter thermophilus TaxID=53573 RepID=UPI003C1DD36F
MIVLGIETSCDETSMAIYDSNTNSILSSKISSQVELHKRFGGVVPEIASRNHLIKLEEIFNEVVNDAKIDIEDIDLIGVTNAPGLIGSLFVGVSFAKGLSYSLKKPLIGVNHLAAHTLSTELEHLELSPPYISLIISGGHTHVYYVDKAYNFNLLSYTIDDAVGECFDKVAKKLGLPYPGGPEIEKMAKNGDENRLVFPIALKNDKLFSFSGIKTAVINTIDENKYTAADICASFQKSILKNLTHKFDIILKEYKVNKLVVTGGVSANGYLRDKLTKYYQKKGINVYFPSKRLSTDNGDMIAYTAYKFFSKKIFMGLRETAYDVRPNID